MTTHLPQGGFVLDASVALSWFLEDEADDASMAILAMLESGFALVPASWAVEFANGMQCAIRRGRTGLHEVADGLEALEALDIRVDALQPIPLRLVTESIRVGLSCHDAAYLLLARDRGLPLATTDRALRQAATADGVQLVA